ncbi:MAG: hypothetical protein LBL61_02765 [Elusimicrobiota bacterium]|jgi:hypothetical protein|nr:hypothetical protein [Elusimicrobiota bacterium]
MQILAKMKTAAACALAAVALAAPISAQEAESLFEITLSSPQQVQDFIKNNEKFFYVQDSSDLFPDEYNRSSWYMDEYTKKFFPSGNVKCKTNFIAYDGAYINPQDVKKIRIRKEYRDEGFRRLRSKYLIYDIKFYGKLWPLPFQSRTAKIYVNSMRKDYGGKPVKCISLDDYKKLLINRSGQKIENKSFTYPSSLYIPKGALAQNINKEKLTREINKNLASALSGDNTGGTKIQQLKQQMETMEKSFI